MEHTAFDAPVRVLVGLGMPRDLETPFQAYTFLKELPQDRNAALHARACEACLSALHRKGGAANARAALVAYARKAGILAPDAEELVAAKMSEPLPMRLAG